jgi:hypothetical protein
MHDAVDYCLWEDGGVRRKSLIRMEDVVMRKKERQTQDILELLCPLTSKEI